MNKNVLISISGLQFTEGEEYSTPVEVISGGNYYRKENCHYILYDEITEAESEITKNTIKIKKDKIEIIKKGSSNVHMIFEKGKKNHTCYNTPFGSLLLAILSNEIQITEDEDEIDVLIDYMLEANYEPIADCKLKMKITSKGKPDFSFS